jgi:gas vesicle protein
MSDNSSSDIGACLAGFVIGGLVGAATAIILAPQSGAETRAQIAAKRDELVRAGEDQYHHARETAAQYTEEYKARASDVIDHTRQQASHLQERIVLNKGQTEEVTEDVSVDISETVTDESPGDANDNNGEG